MVEYETEMALEYAILPLVLFDDSIVFYTPFVAKCLPADFF